jgi:hypothetical protein
MTRRKKRLYPRRLAAFPRYHPPYPIPYAINPTPRNFTVIAEPSVWPAKRLPEAGVQFIHSPYVYEDPFLFSAQNIRYNTVEPLVRPIPYTYGFERGSINRNGTANRVNVESWSSQTESSKRFRKRKAEREKRGASMPTEEMLTKDTTAPKDNSGFWKGIASGLSSTFASMKAGEGRKKRSERRQVRKQARSSSSGKSSFWSSIVKNRGFGQQAVIKRQKDNLLTNLPPRTTNRFAQQVKQQMIGLGPIVPSIKPLQAQVANTQVAKKESSNVALYAVGGTIVTGLLGFLGYKAYQSKKGSQNRDVFVAQIIQNGRNQGIDLQSAAGQTYLTQNGIQLTEYYQYLNDTGNPLGL